MRSVEDLFDDVIVVWLKCSKAYLHLGWGALSRFKMLFAYTRKVVASLTHRPQNRHSNTRKSNLRVY